MRPRYLVAGLFLAACRSSSATPTSPTVTPPAPLASTSASPQGGDASVTEAPVSTISAPSRTAIEAARPTAQAIDEMNVALYAHLSSAEPGNLIYSPASIEAALAMAAAGAKGQTLAEMNRVLHLPADPQRAATDFSALLASWAQTTPNAPTLSIANHVWVDKGHPLESAFVATTRDQYFAPAETLDFADGPKAAQTINGWVAKETHDQITDLVDPKALGPLTRLVLTNAVYFHGKWQSPFARQFTHDAPFTVEGSTKVTAHMMSDQASLRYADVGDAQIVDLPYQSPPTRELVFTIVLPKVGTPLATLEHEMSANPLARWTKKQASTEVALTIPKFKTSFATSLKQTLQAIGMPTAFTPKADFSGISSDKEGLLISDVVHKAMIAVDETGTEAAAATGLMASAGAEGPPAIAATFKADRPFLFFLRDKTTGAILFAGRLVDPTKS